MAGRRRGKGEGSISRHPDGRWFARADLGYDGGKRRVKAIYGRTRADVLTKLREILQQQQRAQRVASRTTVLAAFSDTWLAAAGGLKPSTLRFYRDNMQRIILPVLGRRDMADVRRDDVITLIGTLRQRGLKTTTVRGIVRTLSACLSAAVDRQLLAVNPCLNLGKHLAFGKAAAPEPDPLTPKCRSRATPHRRAPAAALAVSVLPRRTPHGTATRRTPGCRMGRDRLGASDAPRSPQFGARPDRDAQEPSGAQRRSLTRARRRLAGAPCAAAGRVSGGWPAGAVARLPKRRRHTAGREQRPEHHAAALPHGRPPASIAARPPPHLRLRAAAGRCADHLRRGTARTLQPRRHPRDLCALAAADRRPLRRQPR
jgi:hypothetical protein